MARSGGGNESLERCMEALGMPRYATESEVRKAYKERVRQVHPDKGGDPETFQNIQRAYERLVRKWDQDRLERKKVQERIAAKAKRRIETRELEKKEPAVEPSDLRQEVHELHLDETKQEVVPSADLKLLGDEQYDSGNFEKALQYYDAAAAYAKIDNLLEYAELYEARSRTYFQLESYVDAAEEATRCIMLRPIWAPGYLAKASAEEKLEQWVAAQQSYAQLLVRASDEQVLQVGKDGLKRVEDMLSKQNCLAILVGHDLPIDQIAFLPDPLSFKDDSMRRARSQHVLATASKDGTVRIWQAPSGKSVTVLRGKHGGVTAMAWAPDGSGLIAIGHKDGHCLLWGVELGSELNKDTAHGSANCLFAIMADDAKVNHLAFDRFGTILATASEDLSCKVWNVETGELVVALPTLHTDTINKVLFSPNGRCLATASDDQDARVWDVYGDVVEPGGCIHTLGWESGAVNDISYTRDGRLIVIATHDDSPNKKWYRLLVWSAVSGRLCKWYDGHESIITCMSWHPSPEEEQDYELVTSSQDGTLRFWSIAGEPAGAGQCTLEVDEHRGELVYQPGVTRRLYEGAIHSVRYDPTGTFIATGCQDCRVRVYGAESTECLADWIGHSGPVRDVAWSTDGTLLASCSDDGTARIWKTKQDRLL